MQHPFVRQVPARWAPDLHDLAKSPAGPNARVPAYPNDARNLSFYSGICVYRLSKEIAADNRVNPYRV